MYIHCNDFGIVELAGTTEEPIFSKETLRHRELLRAAERSRLSGEPVFTQAALDVRIEALLHAAAV